MKSGLKNEIRKLIFTEVLESLIVFSLMAIAILILFKIFTFGQADASRGLREAIKNFTLDNRGRRVFPQLMRASSLSFSLVGVSLLISLCISLLVGWLSSVKRNFGWLKMLVGVISAVPVFLTSSLAHQFLLTGFFWGVIILTLGNLTLSLLTRHVYIGMLNEIRQPYVIMAQVKGLAPWKHYWRRLASLLITAIKPQIPYYLSAVVVVEWKFNLPGLGDLAYAACAKRPPDLNIVAWVCILTVLIVRILSAGEKLLSSYILPGREAEGGKAESQKTRKLASTLWARKAIKQGESTSRFTGEKAGRRESPILAHLSNLSLSSRFQWIILAFTNYRATIRGYLRSSLERKLVLAFALLVIFFNLCLFGCALSGYVPYKDADKLNATERLKLLSTRNRGWKTGRFKLIWRHEDADILERKDWIFGPDENGRAVLSRLLIGTKPYLTPAFISLFISVSSACLLASIAGYGQTKVLSQLIDRLIDLLDALPKLVVLLAIIVIMRAENYHYKLMSAMGVLFIPDMYHNVKERIKHFQQSGFIEAEKALGANTFRILFIHILWNNCKGTVLVSSAYIIGSVILLDATLGYLGLNQPEFPSWGAMIANNHRYIGLKYANPWTYMAPALATVLAITGFNLLGDGLRVLFSSKEGSAK